MTAEQLFPKSDRHCNVAAAGFLAGCGAGALDKYATFLACEVAREALTINNETKSAYLYDGRIVPVVLSTDRAEWLDLAAGANTLQFDDVGTVAVTLGTSHEDRVL